MLFQFLLFLGIGIIAGVFTGLIPGIHINLIGVLLIAISTKLFFHLNPLYLIVFMTSMAITHTFLDFIPSVFLGCPDTDTELSLLPGHKFLKKGLGYAAVALTAYGSLAAVFLLIIITFPSIIILKQTSSWINSFIPYFLIFILALMVFLEKNKINAIKVIFLTGLLGLSVLNLKANQPLFPLLTGLFGGSSLLISIKAKIKIPNQKIINPKTKILKPLAGAIISAPLCSFFPGLGSGQAAVIGNTLTKNQQKEFLVLIGATNTLVMGFSFISLYAISKTRTGTALAIQKIIQNSPLTKELLILIVVTSFIAGIISFFLTLKIAKIFSKKVPSINYTLLSLATFLILLLMVFAISKLIGIIIFLVSTATGIYCIFQKIKRTHMMACLLIPTIIFYLF